LHPDLKISETTSRRLAPSGPNVDQLPKRTEDGKKVRGCIIPHCKNGVIVSPDYKGQELRLAADRSGDKAFIACYVGDNKKDLHAVTGFAICQKQGKEYSTYDEFFIDVSNDDDQAVAKKYRGKKGKPTNFLTQYGGGAITLSKKLRVPENETQLFIDAKLAAFPGLAKWIEVEQQEILARKYSTTKLGARRHLYRQLMMGDDAHFLRSGLNFEIQSSGAEMTKISLGNIWLEGLLERYDARLYMPVHDEICFSVVREDAQDFCLELHDIMTRPYADCIVPIECSLGIGPNFANMDEIPWDDVNNWLESHTTNEV
jgi:DNA polymerase-1